MARRRSNFAGPQVVLRLVLYRIIGPELEGHVERFPTYIQSLMYRTLSPRERGPNGLDRGVGARETTIETATAAAKVPSGPPQVMAGSGERVRPRPGARSGSPVNCGARRIREGPLLRRPDPQAGTGEDAVALGDDRK